MICFDMPIYSRQDGTYVATVNGYPYHIIRSDPLLKEVEYYIEGNNKAIIPEPASKATSHPTLDQILAIRRSAYSLESDPLFFGAERGENTKEEWIKKVSEIKARYPKPIKSIDVGKYKNDK